MGGVVRPDAEGVAELPDGQVHASSELGKEELVVADLDIDRATRAMFEFDLEGCAELLFGDTVKRDEFASALED